jgi:uncharacterized protein involved in exopolysaccharide biosynthesis
VPDEKSKRREAEPTLMRDVVYVAFKRKYPLIGLLLLGVLIIGYGSMGQKPEYQASARVMIKRLRADYAMPAVTSAVLRRGEVVNSEMQIIMSTAVAAEVVDRLNIDENKLRGDAIDDLQRRIKAKALPESDILDIEFRHTDPEWAALIVNTALDAYLEIRAGVALNYEAVVYLSEQAHRLKAARDSVAAEIVQLGADTGDLVQGLKGEMSMGLKNKLWNEQLTLATRINSREVELAAVRKWLDESTDYAHVPSGDIYDMGTVARTYETLVVNNARLADARARYTSDHPEVQSLERQHTLIERLLRDEVERALKRQEMRLFEWKAQKQAVDDLLDDLAEQDAYVAETGVRRRMLEADLGVRNDVYSVVLARAEEYKVTAAIDPSMQNVSVVSRAEIPSRPTPRPVNMRVVVGVFTIVFGVLLVLVLEKADHTLDRREDVHRFLGVKVLASIPERRT